MFNRSNHPSENKAILQLWRARLALAADRPWLAGYLLRHSLWLEAGLRQLYRQLVAFVCGGLRGKRLRRALGALPALLAGGGLALAISLAPSSSRAANITVNSTVKETPAIQAGNNTCGLRIKATNKNVALLAVLSPAVASQPLLIQAANITVNSTLDGPLASLAGNNTCELREAIEAANTNATIDVCPAGLANEDIIGLPAGTITLAAPGPDEDANDTGDLDLLFSGGPLTINGAAGGTTINGANLDRVLQLHNTTLNLSNVTISGGQVFTDSGGGILNDGRLTLSNSVVSGNTAGQGGGIYSVATAALTLTNSSILSNTADAQGGGIYAYAGTVSVISSTISGNTANGPGGGIYNYYSALTVTDSTISNNTSYSGGGIYNYEGALTVTNSTISGNTAATGGGGLYTFSAYTTTIQNSTFSNNDASEGGGIYNGCQGLMTLDNSTISANRAIGNGGGIYNSYSPSLIITHSTIVSNTADSDSDDNGDGGGIFRYDGLIIATNTIIASNVDSSSLAGAIHPDVSGEIIGSHNNLLSSTTGAAGTIGTGTDIVTTAVNLGPLANNGGNTQTHALLNGSLAIDAGDNAACAVLVNNVDQRGQPRNIVSADGNGDGTITCDIGAFELLRPLIRLPIIFRR